MARTTIEAECWVLVDAAGDYATGKTREEAIENYENTIQALTDTEGFRCVKATLTVPLPEVVELSGVIADDDSEPSLAVTSK